MTGVGPDALRGPTIVVANHPFGGLDGLVAGAAVMRRRSDMRILANSWLGNAIPELQTWLIGVDVFAAGCETPGNAAALRAALKHLRGGGLLVVFPAGVVSHWQADSARVEDPPWSRAVGALARRCNASVVPLYFSETNSVFFQLSGFLHGSLRTALLPRELLGRRGRPVRLRVGKPLQPRQHSSLDDVALTALMRVHTEALGDCTEAGLPCSFGGCLDAFVSVHVPSAPRAMLDRFMTVEGAASYLLWHARPCRKDEECQHRAIESTVIDDGTTIYYRMPQAPRHSRNGHDHPRRHQRRRLATGLSSQSAGALGGKGRTK